MRIGDANNLRVFYFFSCDLSSRLLFLTRFLGGKAVAGFIVAVILCAVGFLLFGGVIGMESDKFFAKQTLPQIRDFQKKYQIESVEFIETAKNVLSKDNGLLQYLHRLI